MIKTKVAFLEGRPFSSRSELFDNFSVCSDWPDKSRPSKKPHLFWSCKQANYRSSFHMSYCIHKM